ncbi:MAG: NAD-dependent epimerase/dehydratase family protein [Actinomycetota bacterium]|nr:NAD-dependent epimerase/dehydratase family protein [Actinomycetota bacterium]
MDADQNLTVAVTGPTGTFGFGLLPLLQEDPRVTRVVGIARRPFDPARHGWTKMDYRRGDVRDPAALRTAFRDADVVVHLAFLVITGSEETTRTINVDGTLNAFRAAASAGVRRFVYASSVAAYGFHADNPVGMNEQWPVRPAERLFYARQKAELEHLLQEEARSHPETALYLLRPPIVLGPHAVGAKDMLPPALARLTHVARRLYDRVGRLPVPIPAAVPDMPVQFVHEEDVGRALLQCVVGAGPAGAYNIAGDGVLSTLDVARELGVSPVPLPPLPARAAARALLRLPFLPRVAGWLEVASHPAIMDTTRARKQLGWKPRYSALEALRDTLNR